MTSRPQLVIFDLDGTLTDSARGASRHGIDTVVVEWGCGARDFDDPANERAVTHVPMVPALRAKKKPPR